MDEEKKKSQAHVLEFFITYSWAILVILVGLGILVYFGMINVEGSTCKIAPKLKCKEFKAEQDRITLKIQNKMDELLLGLDVGVEDCTDMDLGNILGKDNEDTFLITGCEFKIGDEIDKKINFTYIAEDGRTYTKIGKITATIA